jgi:mannose-6-phosphate isomerase-like protein (cupin superfamily)
MTATPIETVNIKQKLAAFGDCWNPRLVGVVNGCHVKLAKMRGEFIWHHHANEDEMFLVISGRLRMELRDRVVEAGAGEFIIIPRGVEHRPVAAVETSVMLFEPATTLNTGNTENERTVRNLDRI